MSLDDFSAMSEDKPSGLPRSVPWVLLHCGIGALDGTVRRRVSRFLYGDTQSRIVNGERKVYSYPGLLERSGGRHFGQSVVMLPLYAAEEAIKFLEQRIEPLGKIVAAEPTRAADGSAVV